MGKNNTSIADRLDIQHKEVIDKNRHYTKSIAEVILLCALQNFALCGHDELPVT